MSEDKQARVANWIQFALLLLSILALATHGEGRLARVEQRQEDMQRDLSNVAANLTALDAKVDQWLSTPHPYRPAQ